MDNEGVAFGDIFNIISEGNTEILNYPFARQREKWQFVENMGLWVWDKS